MIFLASRTYFIMAELMRMCILPCLCIAAAACFQAPVLAQETQVTQETITTSNPKDIVQQVLALADIQINGTRPWDIHVYNEEFYPRVLSDGSLGLGESYMDGWWDSEKLDECMYHILLAIFISKFTLIGR